eukprot:3376564-Pyramimonas_sp.AAC.1
MGNIIGKDGLQHQTPADLSQNPPKLWQQAVQCAENEWGIKIDGIIYGRCVRRLYEVSGASFGRQVIWDCTNRSQYVTRDINPSRQVLDILNTIPGMKDTD